MLDALPEGSVDTVRECVPVHETLKDHEGDLDDAWLQDEVSVGETVMVRVIVDRDILKEAVADIEDDGDEVKLEVVLQVRDDAVVLSVGVGKEVGLAEAVLLHDADGVTKRDSDPVKLNLKLFVSDERVLEHVTVAEAVMLLDAVLSDSETDPEDERGTDGL